MTLREMDYASTITLSSPQYEMPHNMSGFNDTNMCISPGILYKNVPRVILVMVAIIENLIVFIGVLYDRKRLKTQSSVYICIVSIFATNCFVALLPCIKDIYNMCLPSKLQETSGEFTLAKIVNLGQVAYTTTLMFTTPTNLFALMYVLLDGGMFIGPRYKSMSTSKEIWYHKTKRRVAIVMVTLAWVFPFLMTMIAAHAMNCMRQCYCAFGALPNGKACPKDNSCSQVYEGITLNYMSINFGVWFLLMIALLSFLLYAIERYKSSVKRVKSASTSSTKTLAVSQYRASIVSVNHTKYIVEQMTNKSGSEVDLPSVNNDMPSVEHEIPSSTSVASTSTIGVSSPSSKRKFRLSNRFYFSFILTGLHIVTILPTFIISVTERFVDLGNYRIMLNITSGTLYLLYIMISPIIVLACMPSISAATFLLLRNMKLKLFSY